MKTMMYDAQISGYFTNHSAWRTGRTRLFRAGVDRKLIKEDTGHRSDVVDKYQIMSEKQRAIMSDIIANNPQTSTVSKAPSEEFDVSVECKKTCNCNGEVNESNINQVVTKLIEATKGQGKHTIKINIEITTE